VTGQFGTACVDIGKQADWQQQGVPVPMSPKPASNLKVNKE